MFKLPDLPYSYDALEPHIDEATMKVHHDKHHAAYVKNLNDALSESKELLTQDVKSLLSDLSIIPEKVRSAVVKHGGGHANHSFFWKIISPDGGRVEGNLKEAIDKYFSTFKVFKSEFEKSALTLFGSGWVWLVSKGGVLQIENTANQDSPLSAGKTPILCIDVWEHAYYLKYKNKRGDYINAWWQVVNWRKAGELYERR